MMYIRSMLFTIGMGLSMCVVSLPAIIVRRFSPEARFRYMRRWSQFIVWWLKLTCGISHTVEGEENIPDEPVVFLCKHQSTWETFVSFNFLPYHATVIKQELLRIPVVGTGMSLVDPISVDREDGVNALKKLMREGKERLSEGRSILIFPEGTRTDPGERVKYAKSGASLAKKMNRSVVPVSHDAGKYWGRKSFFMTPGVIHVKIGPPISTDGVDAKTVTRQAEAWIEGDIAD